MNNKAPMSFSILGSLVSTMAISHMPPAFAQEPAFALEEVVVTARRRSESLQDVPIAVSAFSNESLEAQGIINIGELAQQVPSTTLEASRATNSTLTAYIRGVGQQDPLAGFEQGVALYIDDVYLARPQGALLDIYDIERIEVLRGPQGTLYGRNAVGGTIKYVTRRLAEEPAFKLRGTLGTHGQQDAVGVVSFPVTEKLRLGATIASFQRDGYGENLTTGDDQYDKDLLAGRISAEFLPNDDWLVRLAYDQSEDKSSPVAGHRPYPGVTNGEPVLNDVFDTYAGAAGQPSTAFINGENEIEAQGGHLSVEWRATDDLTVKSITAYREDDTVTVIDFDSLEVMDFDSAGLYENEQFSQELQFLISRDNWSGVAGLYYLDASAVNSFDIVLGQLIPVLGATGYNDGTVDTEAWSVFGDVTYDFNEQWSLSLGLRYTEDKRSADILRENYIGIGSPEFGNDNAILLQVLSDYEAERTFDNLSPRINLRYNLSDNAHIYGGYSEGWKAGSFDPRGANFATPLVVEGFDDETLDAYEVGFKSVLLDGRMTFNAALFYSKYNDMQIPGSIAVDSNGDGINDTFVGAVTNAGEATISGVELESTFLITERLSLQMMLSDLTAEIDEWVVDDIDISGETKVQNTPERQGFLAVNYLLDLFGGSLNLNANWSYRSKTYQFEIPSPDLDQPSYDMYNMSMVWTSGGDSWQVGLHGKNLTDEEIKTSGYCFGQSGSCPGSLGLEDNVSVFYAPPRTASLTVEYRF